MCIPGRDKIPPWLFNAFILAEVPVISGVWRKVQGGIEIGSFLPLEFSWLLGKYIRTTCRSFPSVKPGRNKDLLMCCSLKTFCRVFLVGLVLFFSFCSRFSSSASPCNFRTSIVSKNNNHCSVLPFGVPSKRYASNRLVETEVSHFEFLSTVTAGDLPVFPATGGKMRMTVHAVHPWNGSLVLPLRI